MHSVTQYDTNQAGSRVATYFRCRRCLYPNTKPDLWFDEHGICSACLAYDARKNIDWAAKEQEFLELVRANPGSTHDVIVACSGGKDSTWQVVKCLELGLRPLAVTATTDHLSPLGRKNLDNIGRLCDHVEVTPNREIRNRIARFALEEIGDISWCEHHLIWSVPARESTARKIPIVLYGECPQNEYGAGPKGSERQTQLTHSWIHEFGGLLGLRLSDVADILGIEEGDLEFYRYPQNAENVKAIFMGAYFNWGGYRNARIAQQHGFCFADNEIEGSFGTHENLDNYQTGIHDYVRWLKFGYSRACDIGSAIVRRAEWLRDDIISEVFETERKMHSRIPDTYLGMPTSAILENICLTMAEFEKICERFENKSLTKWASSAESYQCFSGMTGDASREGNSITAVA